MSGIYIPWMSMPKTCDDCQVSADCPNDEHIDGYNMQKRPRFCQLVPVPPHGRLGNLDDVINDVRHYLCEACSDYFGPDAKTESCDYCGVTMLIKTIERKSSIIPEEDDTDFYTKGHLHLGRVEEGEG